VNATRPGTVPNPQSPRACAVAVALVLLGDWGLGTVPAYADDEGPAVTIYSSADPAGFDPQQFISQQRMGWNPFAAQQVPGFAVVKETRAAKLLPGVTDLKFTDVAQFIDPTTVSILDLTDASTSVLEQNFQFDLASPTKILDRYVDRDIGYVVEKDGTVLKQWTGKLLSSNQGQLVVQTQDGLRFLNYSDPGIRLPALPEGLITKPTLVWKLRSETGGEHKVRTTYETKGMTWRADYNLVLAADDKTADLGAWVSLLNLCGATFKDARLKLVAGDVHRVQPQYPMAPSGGIAMEESAFNPDPGFTEKSFFEYHLYTLPRRTDVLDNSTQQLTLFPTARGVPVERVLVYYGLPEAATWQYAASAMNDRNLGTQSNPKLDVYLRFKNAEASHLGMPMPRGKVRVYKADDADGTLEFIGEDLIDHTPKDETLLVKLGQAFDVVGERKQTDFKIDNRKRWIEESFEIVLRNHKPAAVKVTVKENLYRWTNWTVTAQSDPFTKIDARTIHFDVEVPPDGEKRVTYTVRYTW
jgi:hypothetical protein